MRLGERRRCLHQLGLLLFLIELSLKTVLGQGATARESNASSFSVQQHANMLPCRKTWEEQGKPSQPWRKEDTRARFAENGRGWLPACLYRPLQLPPKHLPLFSSAKSFLQVEMLAERQTPWKTALEQDPGMSLTQGALLRGPGMKKETFQRLKDSHSSHYSHTMLYHLLYTRIIYCDSLSSLKTLNCFGLDVEEPAACIG